VILVDTSVWIDHLRRGNSDLQALLANGVVWCHLFIAGELALGHLKRRNEILALLDNLPQARCADHTEVLAFINFRNLVGSGIGWVDAHLLCAAVLEGLQVWTVDQRLASVAARTGLAWRP